MFLCVDGWGNVMTKIKARYIAGRVLVIDDEPLVAQVLTDFLTEEGHEVTTTLSGTEAVQLIRNHTYDVILTDLVLPDFGDPQGRNGGLIVLETAQNVDASLEVIIISGHGTLHAIKEAIRRGAYDFIVKPPEWNDVIQTVASAMVKRRLKIKRNQLAQRIIQADEDEINELLHLYDQLDSEMKNARTAHRELFDLATRDGLTNLYNFRYLHTQLKNLIANRRSLKNPLSLVMIDADNFKSYNDRHGHLRGNKILQKIAQVLNANIRETDIAARYGGDEFTVLLLETNKKQAIAFAERCVRLIREYPFDKEPPVNQLTISVGVATSPEDARTPDNLIARADEALYSAKQAGGNQARAARKP
jgi:diguanylate cyclase (GGDEF)-like protein